ncbi:MAG: right-handed parallel beta-helix repeat-containing protein, partial [Candidatus Thorarchaeota archaeon]
AANLGGTVYIYNGSYWENVVVNKSVTLQGEERDETIVYGASPCINVTVNNVTIRDMSVANCTSYGIYINASNATIVNNSIYNVSGLNPATDTDTPGGIAAGIYLTGSQNCTVENNTIANMTGGKGAADTDGYSSGWEGGDGVGIYIENSRDNKISNNTIKELYAGSGGSGASRSGNAGNIFGFYLKGNFSNIIDNKNTVEGDPVIYYADTSDTIIEGYVLREDVNPTNLGKIALINVRNFTVRNNIVANYTGEWEGTTSAEGPSKTGFRGIGIYLNNSNNNTFENNTIEAITGGRGMSASGYRCAGGAGGDAIGFYLIASTNNTFSNNTINDLRGGDSKDCAETSAPGDGKRYGFYFEEDSYDNKIRTNNTVDGGNVIYFVNESDQTIENLVSEGSSNPTNLGLATFLNVQRFRVTNLTLKHYAASPAKTSLGTAPNDAYGIYLQSVTNSNFTNITIENVTGGKGSCGYGWGDGPGGGGVGYGVYMNNSLNNTFSNNTIKSIKGGTAGTSKDNYGGVLSQNQGFGFYIPEDSYNNTIDYNNTVDGSRVLYYFNRSDEIIELFYLNSSGNTMNLGKVAFIYVNNFTVRNLTVSHFTGANGLTTSNKYQRWGRNGTAFFLYYVTNSTFANNTIVNITGGQGGPGYGNRGIGGVGGLGIGFDLKMSINNFFSNNNFTDVDGGSGGNGYFGSPGSGLGYGFNLRDDSFENVIDYNNTVEGERVIYYNNASNITLDGLELTKKETPTNLGKMVFINLDNSTIKNVFVANYTGLTGIGDSYTGNPGYGIYLLSSDNNIFDNITICNITGGRGGGDGGYGQTGGTGGDGIGVYFSASKDNYFYNSSIDNSTPGRGGVAYYTGSLGSHYDISSNSDSDNDLVNSTFNITSALKFGDTASSLNVRWFLEVYVGNYTGALENATVTARDVNDNLVFSKDTASNGFITPQVPREYMINQSGYMYFSNYTVNATRNYYSKNGTYVNLTTNKLVNLTLNYTGIYIDTTPPTYSLNSTSSTVAGTQVEHRLKWEDDFDLSGYIFQFCNGTYDGTDCPAFSIISSDDVESGNDSWSNSTYGGSETGNSIWHIIDNTGYCSNINHSSSHCWFSGTGDGGVTTYDDSDDTILVSDVINLSGYSSANLTFNHTYDIESGNWDIIFVEFSNDSGTSWFNSLDSGDYNVTPVGEYPCYVQADSTHPNVADFTQGWCGSASGVWSQATFEINNVFLVSGFRFRFRFSTDLAAGTTHGWYVDDIKIITEEEPGWNNDTWVPMTGTANWSNVTKTI